VVAERHHVGAGVDKILVDLLGDAKAAGGILAIDDDEVEREIGVRPLFPTTSPTKRIRNPRLPMIQTTLHWLAQDRRRWVQTNEVTLNSVSAASRREAVTEIEDLSWCPFIYFRDMFYATRS
jgi:hypothetical protein